MKQVISFYYDAFRIAIDSIFAHKLRAFLTLIGIIIGVAAVVVVGASISGLNSYVTGKIAKILGANHFMIARMASNGQIPEEEWERMNRRNKRLTVEEYEYLKENCTKCTFVGGQAGGSTNLAENGVEVPSVPTWGVTEEIADIADKTIADGRFFTRDEITRQAKVIFIGAEIAEKLFPDGNALGNTIRVRGIPLTVVGIDEKKGAFFGQSLDREIFIPLSLHRQFFGRDGGIQLHGKAKNKQELNEAIEEARQIIRNKRQLIGGTDDTFSMVDVEGVNNQVDQFTGAIAAVVVPITLITLIVGGIVVMNIMLVSVTERTFEVGLRKALGATRKQILLQFLIESSLLCIVGGLLGLLLAALVTQIITFAAGITMTITVGYIVLSVAVSTIIGVVAGLYPAYKAARLDPIVALTKNS